jgi:hypothetical protein
MPKPSEFDRWFKAQYGKRPGGGKTQVELTCIAWSLANRHSQAEALLADCIEWDNLRAAALKVWTAKERG